MAESYLGEPTISLGEICTPIVDCTVATLGPVDNELLQHLGRRGYDQAPVVEPDSGEILGLVTTQHLRYLRDQNKALEINDPVVTSEEHFYESREDDIHLIPLLDCLSTSKVVLIFRPVPEEFQQEVGRKRTYIGLLTYSDLNWVSVRVPIYDLLASVEATLARLVKKHFNDPWEWLGRISEEHQVRILGFWELSKRRGVDVGPVAATMLPQLLNVVGRTKTLLTPLGYSRTEFESLAGRAVDLRNSVMHPVRPLILSSEDVTRLRAAIDAIRTLRGRLWSVQTP